MSILEDLYNMFGTWADYAQQDYDRVAQPFADLYDWATSDDWIAWNNRVKYELADLPVLGWYWRLQDNRRFIEDYLRNRGLTWDDIKYPTRVTGSGGFYSGVHGSMNFISNNVLRLYR